MEEVLERYADSIERFAIQYGCTRRTGRGLDGETFRSLYSNLSHQMDWGANSNHTLSTSTGKAQSNSTDKSLRMTLFCHLKKIGNCMGKSLTWK